MPGFVSPYASAVTENRWRPFSIRPLPNRAYKISKYPALQYPEILGFRLLAFAYLRPLVPVYLSPFAMWLAFPTSDYYGRSDAHTGR